MLPIFNLNFLKHRSSPEFIPYHGYGTRMTIRYSIFIISYVLDPAGVTTLT